jgi:hypothetical protein
MIRSDRDDEDDELLRGARELIFRSILDLNRAGIAVPLPLLLAAEALIQFKRSGSNEVH